MNEGQRKCYELARCYEFMPGGDPAHSQREIPGLFLKHPIAESVTFFGGSFNPFHQGHRACLDLCPEKNILIVPDRNPQKNTVIEVEPYEQFLALAEKLKETPYSLYPGFLASESPNPTSTWLPFVKIKEKNFLMGDDSFMSLFSWIEPEVIIKSLSKLYVVPRTYKESDYQKIHEKVMNINPELLIIYLKEHPFQNVSSTKLREIK